MRSTLAHNQVAAKQFIKQFEAAFTTRSNGATWPKFQRTWKHANQYFRALFRPGSGKSIAGLATRVNADQELLERFVRESPWQSENVERHLRATAPDACQGADAALIVDGMGIPKQGDHSVGVTDQYCGASGGVDNCQVTINCTLASPGQHRNSDQVTWPLGSRLYLPKEWTDEDDSVYENQQEKEQYAQLREDAEIPASATYQPKYEIAADLVERVVDAGVDHACVLGDSNFGRRSSFREQLRNLAEPYVLEIETGKLHVVPESTEVLEPGPTDKRGPARQYPTVPDDVTPETATEIAEDLDEEVWKEVTWNEGTNGTLEGSFYRTRVRVCTNAYFNRVGEETGWLLLQRDHHSGTNDGEGELKAWICWGLDDATLDELVTWAHLRWTIEQYHRDIKQVLGADEFQGRTWRGFHHHLALVQLTQAFVANERLGSEPGAEGLDSFESVARQLVREVAIERLIEKHGLDPETAEAVGVDMLEGFTGWG
ncbi:SRSO17 transposase [Halapricum desulfuricans]|uniref:SRSO17 transposase n=1 Tax=Halapricum desulfuricans TaxID=2841257 RepID=A0A897NG10_9EURY|nr:IS701 family transposase [Halapricum desulfuricans]QSG13380.1 SRSO17 transposase [Halapricum desulfuricans]